MLLNADGVTTAIASRPENSILPAIQSSVSARKPGSPCFWWSKCGAQPEISGNCIIGEGKKDITTLLSVPNTIICSRRLTRANFSTLEGDRFDEGTGHKNSGHSWDFGQPVR